MISKPAGLTSHDCVDRIRSFFPERFKVGHGGTLDPFSTGLLIILCGKATRLAPIFQEMGKTYEGIIEFGIATDTYDPDGKIIDKKAVPDLTEKTIEVIRNKFIGTQEQIPPQFSAKRIGRRRAYDMARSGINVQLSPVQITIHSIDLWMIDKENFGFKLTCSSGTYVRALARDIGNFLGTCAYCKSLVRTQVGPFNLQSANSLDRPFESNGFISFDDLDLGFINVRMNPREEGLLLSGTKVTSPSALWGEKRYVKLIGKRNQFLALCKIDGTQICPYIVFGGNNADQAARQ